MGLATSFIRRKINIAISKLTLQRSTLRILYLISGVHGIDCRLLHYTGLVFFAGVPIPKDDPEIGAFCKAHTWFRGLLLNMIIPVIEFCIRSSQFIDAGFTSNIK